MSGDYWSNLFRDGGWFNDSEGIKLVFPTSPMPSGGETGYSWFVMYKKEGCGLDDDCSYDIPSIELAADRIQALIDHEREAAGSQNLTNIFLAGFSQGAMMTMYM